MADPEFTLSVQPAIFRMSLTVPFGGFRGRAGPRTAAVSGNVEIRTRATLRRVPPIVVPGKLALGAGCAFASSALSGKRRWG